MWGLILALYNNKWIKLINALIKYLNCGNIYNYKNHIEFQVGKFSDIYEKIIPFFNQYNIIGIKYNDFIDWCKVAEIINEKQHLTDSGKNNILIIKQRINKGRNLNK